MPLVYSEEHLKKNGQKKEKNENRKKHFAGRIRAPPIRHAEPSLGHES